MLLFTELTQKIYDKYNYLDGILTEYEARGETYCREYKIHLRLWRRLERRWRRIRKECERFNSAYGLGMAKVDNKIEKFWSKRPKYDLHLDKR